MLLLHHYGFLYFAIHRGAQLQLPFVRAAEAWWQQGRWLGAGPRQGHATPPHSAVLLPLALLPAGGAARPAGHALLACAALQSGGRSTPTAAAAAAAAAALPPVLPTLQCDVSCRLYGWMFHYPNNKFRSLGMRGNDGTRWAQGAS